MKPRPVQWHMGATEPKNADIAELGGGLDHLRAGLRLSQLEDLRHIIAHAVKDRECATCHQDGDDANPECTDHEPFDMTNDDAVDTLHSLISRAREIGPAYRTEEPAQTREESDKEARAGLIPHDPMDDEPDTEATTKTMQGLLERTRAWDAKINDPKGDGSGDDARVPTGDDYNELYSDVIHSLESAEPGKVYIVVEHEPNSEFPLVNKGIFTTYEAADSYITKLEPTRDPRLSEHDIWWDVETRTLNKENI